MEEEESMCNFLKDDVLILAKAIASEPLTYMDGDFIPWFFCHYCDAEFRGYNINAKDFKHDTDCPVLIAQDILTRSET